MNGSTGDDVEPLDPGADLIRVELARILIRETEDTHFLELREIEDDDLSFHDDSNDGPPLRAIPIVIGFSEAAAIERRLMGQKPVRPQTHELLATVIDRLNHEIDRVVISDLRDHTFYAELRLRDRSTGASVVIDARPSDAIALGVGVDVPIYAAEHVLDAGTTAN